MVKKIKMSNKYKIPLVYDTFESKVDLREKLAEFIKNTDRLSMNGECIKCEAALSKKFGSKHAVLFNSGGSANFALLQALKNLGKIKSGDNVGFSSLTWSTNVSPIIQMDLNPIAIDCEPFSFNIGVGAIRAAYNKYGFKVLFITNALGVCNDIEQIAKFCSENDIILLEDNCESLGAKYNNKYLGTFGLAGTLSFYVSHQMSTIEGGAVLTGDKKLYDMLKIVRSNGWGRDLDKKTLDKLCSCAKIDPDETDFTFFDIGFNLRPTEITAFLCQEQLKIIDETISDRNGVFYEFMSQSIPYRFTEFIYPKFYEQYINRKLDISAFCFPIVCKSERVKNETIKELEEKGIQTRPIISGNITKQPFFKKYCKTEFNLPTTNLINDGGFYFSCSPFSWGCDKNGVNFEIFNYFRDILIDLADKLSS